MTEKAVYRNHEHYLAEGWSKEPKEMFKVAGRIIAERKGLEGLRVLDVGCAAGEFLGYLNAIMAEATFTGVDVAEELLVAGRALFPEVDFINASALDLPSGLKDFDLVCAMGCMSIFDESQIEIFWDNMFGAVRPGGLVLVLSPLNEYGVDAMIRHRKRFDGRPGPWETGWNIFAMETIRELVDARGARISFERFQIPMDLPRREDPVRTWTISTSDSPRQLMNGIKLLINHYFMICEL